MKIKDFEIDGANGKENMYFVTCLDFFFAFLW